MMAVLLLNLAYDLLDQVFQCDKPYRLLGPIYDYSDLNMISLEPQN